MRTIFWEKSIPRVVLTNLLHRLWPGVVWSRLSSTRYAEFPDPPLPGPKWIRVRNRQCGICATDLSILYSKPAAEISLAAIPNTKRVYLGHEVVGEVVEVGTEVELFQVGDRVVMEARPAGSPNCFTQEIQPLCRQCEAGRSRFCENAGEGRGPEGVGGGWGDGFLAHESEVWPVPQSLSDDQASFIEPCAVSLHAVLRKPPIADEQVLVIGGGSIGLLTVQMIKNMSPSAQITCLVKYPHQAEAAERFGADFVLFLTPDIYVKLAGITGAKVFNFPFNRGTLVGGFDIIYDCIGSQDSLWNGLRWAKAGGTLVLIGVSFGSMRMDLNPVWHQEVDLLGSLTFGMEDWEGTQKHTFEIICDWFEAGKIRTNDLITHRYPFEHYRRAIKTAARKRDGVIKVTFMYPEKNLYA